MGAYSVDWKVAKLDANAAARKGSYWAVSMVVEKEASWVVLKASM